MSAPQLVRLCVNQGVTFGAADKANKAVDDYLRGRQTRAAVRVAQAVQKYVKHG